MQQSVTCKLSSKHGATLSMALMLLLVCTTVAGIALTAATVVSGRQVKTKDMDKSYYNVTSAAKLFWDELQDDRVVVHVERTSSTAADGQTIWDCKVDGTSVVTEKINKTNATVFELASFDYLFDPSTKELDFGADRKLATGHEGIDWTPGSSDPPTLAEVNPSYVKDATYKPFDVTPSVNLQDHFKTVQVTVRRELANTYEFVFWEKPKTGETNTTSYECTLTAVMMLGGGDFTPTSDNTGYTATTTVSWTPLSMNAGRSGQ